MRLPLALSLLALLGCHAAASTAGSPPENRAAAALTGAACPSAVQAAAGEEWREVRTASFTFCVPAGWTPRDVRSGRAWRGEGVELRWSTSRTPETTTTRERIAVGPGETVETVTQRMMDESRRELRVIDEVIGGQRAELTYNHTQGTYYASAQWQNPPLQFTATARTLDGATRAMQIYRTVRFVAARD